MTLDHLRAELAALALAYPGDTPVHIAVASHGFAGPVSLAEVASGEAVTITLSAVE